MISLALRISVDDPATVLAGATLIGGTAFCTATIGGLYALAKGQEKLERGQEQLERGQEQLEIRLKSDIKDLSASVEGGMKEMQKLLSDLMITITAVLAAAALLLGGKVGLLDVLLKGPSSG